MPHGGGGGSVVAWIAELDRELGAGKPAEASAEYDDAPDRTPDTSAWVGAGADRSAVTASAVVGASVVAAIVVVLAWATATARSASLPPPPSPLVSAPNNGTASTAASVTAPRLSARGSTPRKPAPARRRYSGSSQSMSSSSCNDCMRGSRWTTWWLRVRSG